VAYAASIVSGVPVADGEELGQLGWFGRDTLRETLRGRLARPLLTACGYRDEAAYRRITVTG
jgi:hypothetical protein